MRLAGILGYQLDMARCAALRSLNRQLAQSALRPADTTALLLVQERPGCDQTTLGRALAGNRSIGMKVASRLEGRGLLTRGAGRDRRSRGLFITSEGERALAAVLARHERAEAQLAIHLEPGEQDLLLRLLSKVQQAIDEEEAGLRRTAPAFETARQTSQDAVA